MPPTLPTSTLTPTLSERLLVNHDSSSNGGEEIVVETSLKCTAPDNSWSVEEKTIRKWKVLSYNQLPPWLRDNDYLLHGHRPQLNSFRDCALSVFRIHTETGNIWTHLLGALFFVGLAIELYLFSGADMLLMDKLIFGIYFTAALGCLTFSTVYHTFSCYSQAVAHTCQAFDYVGIAIMITGSLMSYLYYAFYCNKTAQLIYLIAFPVAGSAVAFVTLWPKMGKFDHFCSFDVNYSIIIGKPEFRAVRASVFIAFGISAVIPYIHYYFLIDEELPIDNLKTFGMAIFYIGGACIYANRIPEKLKPGMT